MNGKPVTEDDLLTKLQGVERGNGGDARINLHADESTQYTNIARVLALAQQAGLSKIAFVTSPQNEIR